MLNTRKLTPTLSSGSQESYPHSQTEALNSRTEPARHSTSGPQTGNATCRASLLRAYESSPITDGCRNSLSSPMCGGRRPHFSPRDYSHSSKTGSRLWTNQREASLLPSSPQLFSTLSENEPLHTSEIGAPEGVFSASSHNATRAWMLCWHPMPCTNSLHGNWKGYMCTWGGEIWGRWERTV